MKHTRITRIFLLFDDQIKVLHTEPYDSFVQNMGLEHLCSYYGPGYNIWLRDGSDPVLYLFQQPDFLQGILTMVQSFSINYADLNIASHIYVSYYDSLLTSKYFMINN